MAESHIFVEYSPALGQAIRNAQNLASNNAGGNNPYPTHGKQSLLPQSQNTPSEIGNWHLYISSGTILYVDGGILKVGDCCSHPSGGIINLSLTGTFDNDGNGYVCVKNASSLSYVVVPALTNASDIFPIGTITKTETTVGEETVANYAVRDFKVDTAVLPEPNQPFALSFDGGTASGTGILNIGAGVALANGTRFNISGGTINLANTGSLTAEGNGYVFLKATWSDQNGFSFGANPYVVRQSLSNMQDLEYPIGHVQYLALAGSILSVESFKVPMAIFIKTGTC